MLFSCLPVMANPKVEYRDGIYQIKIDNSPKDAKRLDFISVDELQTNQFIHRLYRSKLTVNAGFFDPKNQKTISYIESKGEGSENPLFNENLISNPVLGKNLSKILNRTEFRVLECENGTYLYDIAEHNDSTPDGCYILTSAQAGPELYPRLRLEEEFFIVKDLNGNVIRESCSVLHKTPRTLIALKNGDIYIFIFTNQHPISLPEAREYLENFGVDKAMAFDGGSSSSLEFEDSIHVISTQGDGNDTGRKLKSFLIYK